MWNWCLYNIYILKIEIEFDSTIWYTLDENINIKTVLSESLESAIILITFKIIMHSNQNIGKAFIVGRR